MAHLGIEPLAFDAQAGRVSTVLTMQPQWLQHTGQAHAGVSTTLADHSMGSAAQLLAPDGFWIITAELKVSLLRPAKGERLCCEAWVVKPGRQIMFTEAEVWAEAGAERQLVVKASATMALVAVTREKAA